jgi:putative sugar O-methyltransferase
MIAEVIIEDALAHINSCERDPTNLSDTWKQTLRERMNLLSVDSLRTMRSPGSPASASIVDSSYMIDSSVLNERAAELLARVQEPGFGAPLRDMPVNGQSISSLFARDLNTAAWIIDHIGPVNGPIRILEVGGGTGILQFILKSFFGDMCSIFSVDIPETLVLQECLLRVSFPDAPWCYKHNTQPITAQTGGLHFINADVVTSQDLCFDVAVNIDSMQEMSAEQVDRYLTYISANLAPRGVLFLQNHYGHPQGAHAEPSEFALAALVPTSCRVAWQLETCSSSEQLRLVCRRGSSDLVSGERIQVLRIVWNLLLSGTLSDDQASEVVRVLSRLDTDLTAAIEAAIPLGAEAVNTIIANARRAATWAPVSVSTAVLPPANLPKTADIMRMIVRYQHRLTTLMEGSGARQDADLPNEVVALRDALIAWLSAIQSSSYWMTYLIGLLAPIGGKAKEFAADIQQAASDAANGAWVVRCMAMNDRLDCGVPGDELAKALLPHRDQLTLHQHLEAYELLRRANADSARYFSPDLLLQDAAVAGVLSAVAKLAVRLNDQDLFARVHTMQKRENVDLGLAQFCKRTASSDWWQEYIPVGSILAACTSDRDRLQAACWQHDGAGVDRILGSLQDSYYDLAWAGRLMLQHGDKTRAHACFDRSLILRPDNFLHCEFLANQWLVAGAPTEAGKLYESAGRIKPNLRHLRGRQAWCALPAELQTRVGYGVAADLDLLFPREQLHFYDLGISWRA